jgi:hypothetical protein
MRRARERGNVIAGRHERPTQPAAGRTACVTVRYKRGCVRRRKTHNGGGRVTVGGSIATLNLTRRRGEVGDGDAFILDLRRRVQERQTRTWKFRGLINAARDWDMTQSAVRWSKFKEAHAGRSGRGKCVSRLPRLSPSESEAVQSARTRTARCWDE